MTYINQKQIKDGVLDRHKEICKVNPVCEWSSLSCITYYFAWFVEVLSNNYKVDSWNYCLCLNYVSIAIMSINIL